VGSAAPAPPVVPADSVRPAGPGVAAGPATPARARRRCPAGRPATPKRSRLRPRSGYAQGVVVAACTCPLVRARCRAFIAGTSGARAGKQEKVRGNVQVSGSGIAHGRRSPRTRGRRAARKAKLTPCVLALSRQFADGINSSLPASRPELPPLRALCIPASSSPS